MRILANRFGVVAAAVFITFVIILLAHGSNITSRIPGAENLWPGDDWTSGAQQASAKVSAKANISFDLSTPPSAGCEELVNDLQQKLIHAYSERLKGVRYANIWGYLETENKGDAAIWSAQQILLSMLGIETMEACRFMEKGCDMKKFRSRLDDHRPHSAIIMAGGGNFNDYYWEDQPSRMKMISTFTDTPIRAFPQSIFMTKPDRIQKTREDFGKHHDLQLAARDKPSHDWLVKTFGDAEGIETDLVPDIAFMWGNRSDFRTNGKKTHDVLILARKDMEISAPSDDIAWGEGELELSNGMKVTYNKVDWRSTPTPDIGEKDDPNREEGKNQRAWAKAAEGFRMLGSARFVITDRLHGHILSTVIGVPHVLMDSKLGKSLNFHNTWTRDCACTRVTENITQALDVAKLWFEKEER